MKITFKNKRLNSILKKGTYALATISLIGVISIKSYDIYIDSKLKEIEFSKDNIDEINNFYNENDYENVIIVMNDSQGVNLNVGFWQNSYPEYLQEQLNINVINASSLRYNKTSHIDMILKHNLSVSEIKQLNNQGANITIKNVLDEANISSLILQNLISKVGVKIFGQKITTVDDNIYITDILHNSKQPIVIYSSGANDFMFLISANPTNISKYDSQGNLTEEYLYAKNRIDNNTIDQIMSGIESNFKNIYSINPNTKIIALSIYVPESFRNDEFQEFANAIDEYNNKLEELCKQYDVIYIDETQLGEVYNQNKGNFHINEVGHKKLASILIDEISQNLYTKQNSINQEFEYDDLGLEGVYYDLLKEISYVEYSQQYNYYEFSIYQEQVEEKIVDADICKKLLR